MWVLFSLCLKNTPRKRREQRGSMTWEAQAVRILFSVFTLSLVTDNPETASVTQPESSACCRMLHTLLIDEQSRQCHLCNGQGYWSRNSASNPSRNTMYPSGISQTTANAATLNGGQQLIKFYPESFQYTRASSLPHQIPLSVTQSFPPNTSVFKLKMGRARFLTTSSLVPETLRWFYSNGPFIWRPIWAGGRYASVSWVVVDLRIEAGW